MLNREELVFSDGASGNCNYVGIFNGKIRVGGFLLGFLHPQDEFRNARRLPLPQSHGKTESGDVGFVKTIAVVFEMVKKIFFLHTIKIYIGILKLAYPCLLDN